MPLNAFGLGPNVAAVVRSSFWRKGPTIAENLREPTLRRVVEDHVVESRFLIGTSPTTRAFRATCVAGRRGSFRTADDPGSACPSRLLVALVRPATMNAARSGREAQRAVYRTGTGRLPERPTASDATREKPHVAEGLVSCFGVLKPRIVSVCSVVAREAGHVADIGFRRSRIEVLRRKARSILRA